MWPFKPNISKLRANRDIPRLVNLLNYEGEMIAYNASVALVEVGNIDTISILFGFYKNKSKNPWAKVYCRSAIQGLSKKFTSGELSQLRHLNVLDLYEEYVSNEDWKKRHPYGVIEWHTELYKVLDIITSFADPKYISFLIKLASRTDSRELNALAACRATEYLASLLTKNDLKIHKREDILNKIIGINDPDTPKILQGVLEYPIIDPDAGKLPVSENMISDHPDWYRDPSYLKPNPDKASDLIAKIKGYASIG